MPEKIRKPLIYIIAAVNFIMTAIYMFLTPYISDDIIYMDQVRKANNIFDLFAQEYAQYMDHSGRSVAHIILRFFLYMDNKAIFNIVAAFVFTLLAVLIYINVDFRKKYDVRIFLAILLMMWMFEPTISNSVFWETGSCNYLFTGTLIMGFITIFIRNARQNRKRSVLFALGMLVYGIMTGWCNENTSGGIVFFILLMMFVKWLETKNLSGIRLWMITGLIGNLTGLFLMVVSPGNASRAATKRMAEAHTGLQAWVARFLKMTMNIKNYYLIFVLVFAVLIVVIAYKAGSFAKFMEAAGSMLMFGLMFFVTVYALIAAPEPQLRACYGASLFLMTGIAQGIAWIVNEGYKEDAVQILLTGLVTVLSIIFIFTYIEDGANLARIKREFDERDAYLAEAGATGVEDELVVEAPMLRPGWENRFSMAYESDIAEDKDYWINQAYSQHYNLWFVIGVDRETWTEY